MTRGRLIGIASAASTVVVIIAAMLVIVTIQAKPPVLASVTYATYLDTPEWDESTKTESSPERLTQLAAAMHRAGWRIGQPSPDDPGCHGGLRIEMTLTYADGTVFPFDAYACGPRTNPVAEAAAEVVVLWR